MDEEHYTPVTLEMGSNSALFLALNFGADKIVKINVSAAGIAELGFPISADGAVSEQPVKFEKHTEGLVVVKLKDGRSTHIQVDATGRIINQSFRGASISVSANPSERQPPPVEASISAVGEKGEIQTWKVSAEEVPGENGTTEVWAVTSSGRELRQVKIGDDIIETWKGGLLMTARGKYGKLVCVDQEQSAAAVARRPTPAIIKIEKAAEATRS